MPIKRDFQIASVWSRLALCLLFISSVLIIIAFSCTGWGENGLGEHWGLWRKCGEYDVDRVGCLNLDGSASDWWAFTQAASVFGLIGTFLAFGMLILYIFTESCKQKKELVVAMTCICFFCGIMNLIGCIVFGVYWDRTYMEEIVLGQTVLYWLSYAYGLSLVASILDLSAGFVLVVETKNNKEAVAE
ncbi:hypothetical protein FSP39_017946 [Pinctada imbricata]|uniref:Uncharacterized protein n=1 Tax=Pinctada imbricata TaxID=66713 RepID=A0AA88XX10_PINIB|nr:hypothetical protein FSP39_017946 [Pinctada imbricata]